jgi:hypothetical protein
MAYRMYNGLDCENPKCRKPLGLLDGDGRERRYCNNACKQEAYRLRRAAKRNTQALLNAPALVQRWYLAGINGALLEKLRKLYIAHGEEAASLATDAVLLAAQEVRVAMRR